MRTRFGLLTPIPILFLTSCGRDAGPATAPATVSTTDSAGVAIVVDLAPQWSEGEGWQVVDTPILSLGDAESDGNQAFDRIESVVQLFDGTVAVIDERAMYVSYFDSDGEFLRTFGGPGDGPGEFNGPALLGLRADTLWIFDERQQRVTSVHGGGVLGEVVTIEAGNLRHGGVGLLPGGGLIAAADLLFSEPPTDMDDLMRFDAAYLRIGRGGEVIDTILVVPGNEAIVRATAQTVEIMGPILSRGLSHAIWNGRLVQSSQEQWEIGVYDPDGTLRRLIRRPDVDLAVDPASYAALVDDRVSSAPDPARPGLRVLYEEMPRAGDRAPFTDFLVDSEGFLWVRDFVYGPDAVEWSVFEPQGAWLGVVRFPDGFRPTQILEDRVTGVWTDDLEVEHARLYPLERD